MKQALRSGVGVAEFWEMTPYETVMTIEAAIWREEQGQKQGIARARLVAMLTRAKRIPPLKQLLSGGPAKPLRGELLEKRRQEFRQMTATMKAQKLDLEKLVKARRQQRRQKERNEQPAG